MTRTEPSSEHCQYRLSPYFYLWCVHWYSFPTDLECVEDLWTWRSFLLQLLECLALQFRFHVWLERHSVSAFNTSLGARRRGEPGGGRGGGLRVTMKGVKITLLQGLPARWRQPLSMGKKWPFADTYDRNMSHFTRRIPQLMVSLCVPAGDPFPRWSAS